MSVLVEVPPTTALADLDEALRALLERDLARHGFDGVRVAFDAPTKEWAAALSAPTVNLFLFDLREQRELRSVDWNPAVSNGPPRERRPPFPLQASFAVTAWTRAVEDEHRLLSQAVAVLYAHPELPEDVLGGVLRNGGRVLQARVGQPREGGGADFWLAVGGQYKASVDYAVTIPIEAGTVVERGPEVRTRTLRAGILDGPRGTVEETHRVAGVVHDADGAPVADVWVLAEGRGVAVSDARGRFAFERMPSGAHPCRARAPDGREAVGEIRAPGMGVELVLGAARAAPRKGRGR